MVKKLVFITGTRADYGKIKSILRTLSKDNAIEVHIFATGMHMLKRYGLTKIEIEKDQFENLYCFINHTHSDSMDVILGKTIIGFSDYVKELEPDLIVVHGDRVEALAGAIVGALNNVRVAHIEGGEVSGTIDESIRHSVTKLAHIHLVANERAKKRLMQMGELEESIKIVGSPDIDIMLADNLPSLESVSAHYGIKYEQYAILLYHPVTTETGSLENYCHTLVEALMESDRNYVVVYPNNDDGSDVILRHYQRLKENPRFQIFPSIRFESFLTLMKHADFMIGNSSAGVREAPCYGVPSINIGTRQNNRAKANTIYNVSPDNNQSILDAINDLSNKTFEPFYEFGKGDSTEQIVNIFSSDEIWRLSVQKLFKDLY